MRTAGAVARFRMPVIAADQVISGRWIDEDTFELVAPIDVVTDRMQVSVPAGTRLDFASVPRIFWPLIPRDGLLALASAVHDYLYLTHAVPREDADGIFREIMDFSGVAPFKSWVVWKAVRLFGGGPWEAAMGGGAPKRRELRERARRLSGANSVIYRTRRKL